ncbi:glycosyl transferase family 2 [Stanieria cyanosphaera PCC 7437]|uniref:Glycosyl transferase family 2 n=1 Tax=Stanieria cyanosphaera (strain ATCC 29371 / PCC 7437) TaxID=111780 RepID=K9XTA9_STAC7|nr:glycosyltransferase [Stanieria cyanosphaera]AFZ35840.1 glycosyl transferase family 2 [Stanieria cyanosphaera PCC 7437]
MIKISVIIPAYNGDRYIGKAIDSVLQQSYRDYEIIVVDDGSSDRTSQIVQSYGSKVRYISQQNQGVAAARNQGLEVAQGEYIAFLDQDDFFLPNKLASQVALLEQKSCLGIVNSGWQIVNQDGEFLAAVQPWQTLPQLALIGLIVWKPVFLGAMLFRHSWLKKSGGFDVELEQTPDVDLVLRLAQMGCQADWIKDTTVCYRQHELNASKKTLLQAQELDFILERFFAQANLSTEIKDLENQSRYQSLVWSAWRLYETEHLVEMAQYLLKSLSYTNKHHTETVFEWIKAFKSYASEYGNVIDVYQLTNTKEWQELINQSVF